LAHAAASAEAENRVQAMAGAMVHPARDEDGFRLKDPRDDGAVFTRFGSVDVAPGRPLRHSHSPAEIIATKNLDARGKIVEILVQQSY